LAFLKKKLKIQNITKSGYCSTVFNCSILQCNILKYLAMINRDSMTQIKWLFLALTLSFVLVSCVESTILQSSAIFKAQHTFLGLNLFLEVLIFFVFSTFVVFGIKGFFEMYSQKSSNTIIFVSGVLLVFVIFILCYQILFQE
jgi:hypothetical protein